MIKYIEFGWDNKGHPVPAGRKGRGGLVDGYGPTRWSDTQGEGYSGGGCREDRNGDNLEDGRPVIVLIEDWWTGVIW